MGLGAEESLVPSVAYFPSSRFTFTSETTQSAAKEQVALRRHPEVENGDDVRVAQLRHGPRLADKTVGERLIHAHLERQQLDRHLPVQRHLPRPIDRPMPPRPMMTAGSSPISHSSAARSTRRAGSHSRISPTPRSVRLGDLVVSHCVKLATVAVPAASASIPERRH